MRTLNELKTGEYAKVMTIGGEGELRQHLLDMGLIPGVKVRLIKRAPMGDPLEVLVHGYSLTLRSDDAMKIDIVEVDNEEELIVERVYSDIEHPGLGESGRYHDKATEDPLPEDIVLSFALAGNQNCGKTTLFNQLTGANQHVGNFPGVTVDRKDGAIRGYDNTMITDLPGIYSLSPYTNEELVTRQFILKDQPEGIINIVDATNIERNLYLTMQLMELETPMVLALNMMDEVRNNGGTILINEMEQILGIPVVPIVAAHNEGVDELVRHAIHVARYQERPGRTDFCDLNDHGGAVHRCIHAIAHLVADHCERAGIPRRFAATKMVEGDMGIMEALQLDQNEKEMIEHIITQMENERGLDRQAAIADMRFTFIQSLVEKTVIKPSESMEHKRSVEIDRILTGRYTAIPVFIGIMGMVFWLTFNVIGAFLQSLTEAGVEYVINLISLGLQKAGVGQMVYSLIVDGILAGVGSIVSFVPVIVTLFFFLSLLEDTGYMARVAFVMDKLLRKIGLSGRSIVPMLVGFGCTVPAVMAARTLPSDRDRWVTILLTPFMSCSAKLPIYAFLVSTFFPGHGGLIMTGLYVLGIVLAVLFAWILKWTYKGEPVPFVMELPNYRMPGLKNVALLLWDKAKDFLERAFTVIFLATIVIWFMQKFDMHLDITADPGQSILAVLSGFIAPIFVPLGFGDWRICAALISGFMAKESVVSTISVLFSDMSVLHSLLSGGAAMALLVFCLLYTPCVAATAAIRRELGYKAVLWSVFGQCFIAWIMAFVTRIICG